MSESVQFYGLQPPGASAHGLLQARTLEWAAICRPPGDLPNTGIEPVSPALAGGSLTTEPLGKLIHVNRQFYFLDVV